MFLSAISQRARVDVIIPVYLGQAQTQACIESVLRAPNKTAFELIVIDDCSPDSEIQQYLAQLSSSQTCIKLQCLRNQRNLGFTATVNRGMARHFWRDVVLLNSDTLVSANWLDRLRSHALSQPKIATVTPFSNNATIASFPKFCADNPMPSSAQLGLLAAAAWRANAGDHVAVPTAVGFCMYISRACIRQLGIFDVANFGKGYGEENDFCMRATKAGWQHMLATDTYVAHHGAVSFSSSSLARKQIAEKVLNELHPEYNGLVSQFIAKDPVRPYRERLSAALDAAEN